MKKLMQGTAATLGLLAALAVGAQAQQTTPAPQGEPGREGPREGRRHRNGKRLERAFELGALGRLKLSDEQRAQLRILRENLRQNTETQREELRQLFADLDSVEQLTDAQRERARELRASLRQEAERHHQQVLDMLTPEQRGQIEQWKQERRQGREERRERRRQRHEEFRRRQGETM